MLPLNGSSRIVVVGAPCTDSILGSAGTGSYRKNIISEKTQTSHKNKDQGPDDEKVDRQHKKTRKKKKKSKNDEID
jgi:hypothetical protein